jgi:CRP-like cAMP-binding protein
MALTCIRPQQNHLLGTIPEAEWGRFASHLAPVYIGLGEVIYESGVDQSYAYFPTDSIVSLMHVSGDGSPAEIAIIGNEGLVGISLFMGGRTTPNRAVVQSAGHAFRIRASYIRDEFTRAATVQHHFLRYAQALLTQIGQTAACNRHHSVNQQLCRWLLMSLNRLPTNELTMTQELIANMLGVQRQGITHAAGKLQRAGVIEYHRGRIRVLDRSRLERSACECYAVVKKEFMRLLPWLPWQSGEPSCAATIFRKTVPAAQRSREMSVER